MGVYVYLFEPVKVDTNITTSDDLGRYLDSQPDNVKPLIAHEDSLSPVVQILEEVYKDYFLHLKTEVYDYEKFFKQHNIDSHKFDLKELFSDEYDNTYLRFQSDDGETIDVNAKELEIINQNIKVLVIKELDKLEDCLEEGFVEKLKQNSPQGYVVCNNFALDVVKILAKSGSDLTNWKLDKNQFILVTYD